MFMIAPAKRNRGTARIGKLLMPYTSIWAIRPKESIGYPHLITNATMEVIPIQYPTGIPSNKSAMSSRKNISKISI